MFGRKRESQELVPVETSQGMSPFDEMERWFEDAWRMPFGLLRRPFLPSRWLADEITPSVDMFEEGDDLVVKAELPGMSKDDLRITLNDDVLTLSGEKKKEEKVERKNYYRIERSSGSFTRSFRLPVDVETSKIKAKFRDGVLEVRVPKTEEAKRKEIEIKVN